MTRIIYVIPAYRPSSALLTLVRELRTLTSEPILVVNDGSLPDAKSLLDEVAQIPQVTLLHHAVNLGKGAALKTAMNHALLAFPEVLGIVTLDADGQHRCEDAVRIGQLLSNKSESLVLGCREFGRRQTVPLRSRFGNLMTQKVFQLLTGLAISDTQTGLRGIPKSLILHMLRVPSTGYEFETDMLMAAVRHQIPVTEVPIPTLYFDGNSSSHFNPLRDSIRIYFVFIRFAFTSLATAAVDFLVFFLVHAFTGRIFPASIAGRVVAGTFNFLISKKLVFLSRGQLIPEILKYATLVAFFLFLSNSAIHACLRYLGMNVYFAKILVEGALFALSFATQRLIVFPASTQEEESSSTDWDAYYQKPFTAASFTRKITIRRILQGFQTYADHLPNPTVLELGGGNSCVYGTLAEALQPRKYLIIDQNQLGLDQFKKTYPQANHVELKQGDVLHLKPLDPKADLCLSIGLVEHFSIANTQKAIRAHFECIQPEGVVLITFPTPTWLYRITRRMAELLGLWKFPDERPCQIEEVTQEIEKYAEILHCSIIWPIFLTQGLIVARPHPKT